MRKLLLVLLISVCSGCSPAGKLLTDPPTTGSDWQQLLLDITEDMTEPEQRQMCTYAVGFCDGLDGPTTIDVVLRVSGTQLAHLTYYFSALGEVHEVDVQAPWQLVFKGLPKKSLGFIRSGTIGIFVEVLDTSDKTYGNCEGVCSSFFALSEGM